MQPNPSFQPEPSLEPHQPAQPPVMPDPIDMPQPPPAPHQPDPLFASAPSVGRMAMEPKNDVSPGEPPSWEPNEPSLPRNNTDQPVPVVRVLSVRGVEYGMMTIALWTVAVTLAWVILNMLNGSSGFSSVVVPTSALVICVPVFGFFFLRLKRAEGSDPNLRLDPSKRRWSQTTQFLAYIACLVNLIYFVYVILQRSSGDTKTSIGKSVINLLVVLAIAGGVLAYYWLDEHRTRRV